MNVIMKAMSGSPALSSKPAGLHNLENFGQLLHINNDAFCRLKANSTEGKIINRQKLVGCKPSHFFSKYI